MDTISIFAVLGFLIAAYAVVGNDALQTMGTFINSNSRFPWWVLFAYAVLILVVTFYVGWFANGGDPSFGRLSNASKYPVFEVKWYHILPPLALLALTSFGVPVSTTFMVLAIFATSAGLQSMLVKSLAGYVIAFMVGGLIYAVLALTLEKWFVKTKEAGRHIGWLFLQWTSTAFLWSVWLMQDLANLFVFLPRNLSLLQATLALLVIVALLAITFANRGGPVQKVLRTKSYVTDVRSATIIDLTYAILLLYFKEMNNIPMSTTWVFMGLIAGREFSIASLHNIRSKLGTLRLILSDAGKAFVGLSVSVLLAVYLPRMASGLETLLPQVFAKVLP